MASGVLRNAAKSYAGMRKSEWYDAHMEIAGRAVAARIPLVDLVLEIRDARLDLGEIFGLPSNDVRTEIPVSSGYESLRNYPPSDRRVIVLNKADLANRSQTKEWLQYFKQQGFNAYGVNSHNREEIQKFLNFLQAQIRALKKTGSSSHTNTVLLVGIPNVGKSALSNSLHLVGRVKATEKGKLKRATVSAVPGETKNISCMKVGSHPNIYILDTPGILPPSIDDDEAYVKLCLTGAIRDCMVKEHDLAQTLLSVLNLNKDFAKWKKYSSSWLIDQDNEFANVTKSETNDMKQHPADHTQDCIVNEVRGVLFDTVSAVNNSLENEKTMTGLIEHQWTLLNNAFHIHEGLNENGHHKVAAKLLNLCRTGRIGHFTLDLLPTNIELR